MLVQHLIPLFALCRDDFEEFAVALGFTLSSSDLTVGRTEPITPSSVGARRPITRARSSTWMTAPLRGKNSDARGDGGGFSGEFAFSASAPHRGFEEVLQRVEHATGVEGRRAFEGFLKKMRPDAGGCARRPTLRSLPHSTTYVSGART